MIVLEKENIKPFDVDDTLVMHDREPCNSDTVMIVDPYSSFKVFLAKNHPMIRLLKEEKARGGTIVVWSRGGYAWAKAVVEALELEPYVDLIMSKPMVYFDDKDVSEWLKDRVYIGPNTRYKF